ncbi:MAG: EamA family transporter, partial [Gammaproteobacteria bacterium]
LLLTAFLWGTAFIFQKDATDHLDAFSFNFLRFAIAIPALFALKILPQKLFMPDKGDIHSQRRLRHSAAFIGIGAGVLMFLGISLQQAGLTYTTAGKSGFLTSLYIIIVPIIGLMIGQRCRLEVWVGALITVVGIYLLGKGEAGNIESQFNRGDVITLICAFAWAAQVVWLGVFARYANVLQIALIQMTTVAALSGTAMLVVAGQFPSGEVIWHMRYAIVYTGVISAAVAFTLQILGQRYVPPTNAALIMSTEAIFAMLGGIIFRHEAVTVTAFIGCSLIMTGIILAQLQGRVFRRRRLFRH